MTLYYKIAKPSGWDFYTGSTINYRDALNNGGIVKHPAPENNGVCAPGVLHASLKVEDCFQGGGIPCSVYRVEGTPVNTDDVTKHGFHELKVVEELNPSELFKWRYDEACNPTHPFKITPPEITDGHIELVQQWSSVWHSVWHSVGDSVWDSVNASVGDSVWHSVNAYIGHIFAPVVTDWQGIDHEPGQYPFQPAVDLWMQGLVPSFDGKLWRLHGHEDARILWEGEIK